MAFAEANHRVFQHFPGYTFLHTLNIVSVVSRLRQCGGDKIPEAYGNLGKQPWDTFLHQLHQWTSGTELIGTYIL